jgi:hypothetical protein
VSSIVQIIIITGAMCASPIEAPAANTTEAYKVPCAIIVNGGGQNVVPKDQSRLQPAPPIKAKAKTKCRKKWYWKNGKKRYRCR